MKGYIHSTLGQHGKYKKPTPKADDLADGTQEEDNQFPEAKRYLMIFGCS